MGGKRKLRTVVPSLTVIDGTDQNVVALSTNAYDTFSPTFLQLISPSNLTFSSKEIYGTGAPAITKSWLPTPTTTRCCSAAAAHQRPQPATSLQITGVGAIRAVPSRFFKEYMVEMEWEILLVFLIYERSLAVVDHVEVFRPDFNKLVLVKVERLRGKTMFLKEICLLVDSAKFGYRDDRVYFTEGKENRRRMFDMKTCCISTVL